MKPFMLILGAVLLSACGGGGGDVLNNSGNSATTISAFEITGSATGTPVPIDANINSGNFHVHWEVNSSDPYHVDLYVSADDVLDTNTDIRFFEQNCGSGPLMNCTSIADFDCAFTTQNHLSCGTLSAANKGKDLTTFLTGLPMQAGIIMKACNGLVTSCKTQVVKVEFR